MKNIILFLILIVFFIKTPTLVFANIPLSNQMKLGEIDGNLPEKEMRGFYSKMEPVMFKYFGPPYSNASINIKTNLEGTVHDTGYIDNEQTLILAGQAKNYLQNKNTDKNHALQQIYGNMMHELSHGLFYFGNKRVSFNPQWVNEGWVKLSEILLAKDLKMYDFGISPYFNYYLDKDTIAGTTNWGSSKQSTNHGIVYDVTSVTHLTLFSALSTSNDNLDFLKTFNNYVYDWVKKNNQTNISFEQYKQIMANLLKGKTVDGQSAYDWYFSNSNTLIRGNMGNHLGVTVDGNEIVAYVFDRTNDGKDIKETGLSDVNISIKVTNYDGSILLEKTVVTDTDGNAKIQIPENKKYILMTIEAKTTILNKPLTANTFYFYAPSDNKKLTGILIDEAGKPLPAKYINLLKSNLPFEYKDKGVFVINVPNNNKIVTLDFIGHTQEVNKGPFARMYAFKIPNESISEAANQPESAFKNSTVDNINNPISQVKNYISTKNRGFIVGLFSLVIVGIILLILKKYNK